MWLGRKVLVTGGIRNSPIVVPISSPQLPTAPPLPDASRGRHSRETEHGPQSNSGLPGRTNAHACLTAEGLISSHLSGEAQDGNSASRQAFSVPTASLGKGAGRREQRPARVQEAERRWDASQRHHLGAEDRDAGSRGKSHTSTPHSCCVLHKQMLPRVWVWSPEGSRESHRQKRRTPGSPHSKPLPVTHGRAADPAPPTESLFAFTLQTH